MLGQGPAESVAIQTDGPQRVLGESLGNGDNKCKNMKT